jgi:pimeloyl-ACP methyl ester carboxylesterase
MKPLKKAALLFLTIPCVSSRISKCSDKEIEAMVAGMPQPETKDHVVDLNGWEYLKVTSEITRQTYYYYHIPAKKENAPVFVLVHGMFLDGRTFLNFDELTSDFELVALDLPVASPFFKGQVEDFPKLLQDFLSAMNIVRMYLGGVSLGGQIAALYMVSPHKTQVDGLVLVTTDMVKNNMELASAQQTATLLFKITKDDDRRILCLLNKVVTRKKRKALGSEKEVLKIFAAKPPSFYRQVLHIALNMKEPPDLKSINVPTLIVLSDADTTMPFDSAKHLVEHIPGAEMKVIKNAEHSAAYTHGPLVTSLIKAKFLGK